MNLLYQSILLTAFDAGEMYTVDAALSHYQAHCRREISQGTKLPFWAHDNDIDRMHRRLRCGRSGNTRGVAPDAPAPTNPSHQSTFTALFYESEMRTLYAALSHYQVLCRHEIAPGTLFWAHDLDFESVRKKLHYVAAPDNPPDDDFLDDAEGDADG
jgi:hypothetical protein